MLYALSRVLPSQLIYFYRAAGVGVAPRVIQLQIDHNLVRARRRVSSTYALQTAFGDYIAYALYAALDIAGPILTFNDFMWQVRTIVSLP